MIHKCIPVMLFLAICLVFVTMADTETNPQVTIDQGTLRGQYKMSRAGKQFASFTKIPFAKPPVGDLRFKVARLLLCLVYVWLPIVYDNIYIK